MDNYADFLNVGLKEDSSDSSLKGKFVVSVEFTKKCSDFFFLPTVMQGSLRSIHGSSGAGAVHGSLGAKHGGAAVR